MATSPKLRFTLFVLTAALSRGQPHGTAAVAIWTPTRALLAADSMVGHMDNSPATATCKIRKSGRFFFSLSGLYRNANTGFDAWKIAADVIPKARTVSEAGLLMEKALGPPLDNALEEIKRSNSAAYAANFKDSFLAFFVVGVDAGKPVMSGRNFVPGEVLKSEFPGEHQGQTGGVGYNTFGEHSAMDRMFSDTALTKLLADPIRAARVLIQAEIDGTPTKVGPPIAILGVTRLGHEWISPGVCGNQ